MDRAKILIVDDEPFNVDYLEQELENLECDTLSAVNGQEALDQVQAETPDLVLLDIMMPVMDGFQVLTRLKADPTTRDIPVIVISASNDLQSVVRGIRLGAEDYLPKPFEPTLLLARISSSLEKKRLRDLQTLYLRALEREMEIAREIQKSFLPACLPQVPGWEIGVYFQAAREVAGDYYDAFTLPDGSLAFVVGDVCGKGVGAALFMTLFRSLIRASAFGSSAFGAADTETQAPPERLQRIISFTNRYLNETHEDANVFSTLFMGILDPQTQALFYANCGNEAPLLVREGCVIAALKPTGPVVGVLPEANFAVQAVCLAPGDLLLVYTDGIPDALNPASEPFGTPRLVSTLQSGPAGPALLLERICAQLGSFTSGAEQFDDITLLALQRRPDPRA